MDICNSETAIIVLIVKQRYSAPENGYKEELCLDKECPVLANGASVDNQGSRGLSIEDAAATQIQTAYRAYVVHHVPCYFYCYHFNLYGLFFIIFLSPVTLLKLKGLNCCENTCHLMCVINSLLFSSLIGDEGVLDCSKTKYKSIPN